MPEQLTKHPDVTLEVLRSAGAQCGTGEAQQILTACPAERFCKLPGGEVCVYGVSEAGKMTQMTPADWKAIAQTHAAPTAVPAQPPQPQPGPGDGLLAGSAGGLVVGALLGVAFSRSRRRVP
jgi:hypothetical protein